MRIPPTPGLSALALLVAFSFAAPPVAAQTEELPRQRFQYPVVTGRLFAGRQEVLTDFVVEVTGARWVQLQFGDLELGGDPLDPERARIRITSVRDGAVQHLDAVTARQWGKKSAYFNGDTVLVELLAGPRAGGARVQLESVEAGIGGAIGLSICGPTDDRTPTDDPRSARLMPVGCTGWIFDDCFRMFLTAGHCASSNMQVVQFNVPPSSGGGSVNHPPPSQQYAIDTSSIQTQGGAGVGQDWAYFGAFPNTETGLTPWQAQGDFFELATPPTQSGTTMRITGYGTASGVLNQVQQTSTGPLDSLNGTTLAYVSDTTGGNSGSPVILHGTGQAVGIHTHGGCSSSGGSNKGTSILLSALQQALNTPKGICAEALLLFSDVPETVAPNTPLAFTGRWIADPLPGCAALRYRVNGGAFQTLPLTELGGGLVQFTIPGASCGDAPEWYIELVDAVCGSRTLPANAPLETFSSAVGDLVVVLEDDLEQDLGWTTEILGATAGWWQRGVPVDDPSWAYDPASDADGSGQCWLTQNELGNTDVDNGAVRLTSYAIALPNAPSTVEYAYFLRLTNATDDRLLVEGRVEPAGAWVQLASHQQNNGLVWTNHAIDALQLAAAGIPQGSTIRLRFTANDSGTQSIVEAGVDALRVRAVTCDNGTLGTNSCVSGISGATIGAVGSASISANDFTLQASNVPPFANGLFFHGDALQQTPFGNGFLCVSGSSGLCRLTPVVNAGAQGVLSKTIDFPNQPSNTCTITPGTTRHFQAWFRVGATFDLTDALTVQFTN